jgi:uncharacterized membrane protein
MVFTRISIMSHVVALVSLAIVAVICLVIMLISFIAMILSCTHTQRYRDDGTIFWVGMKYDAKYDPTGMMYTGFVFFIIGGIGFLACGLKAMLL